MEKSSEVEGIRTIVTMDWKTQQQVIEDKFKFVHPAVL
jgi:hypothetical protein